MTNTYYIVAVHVLAGFGIIGLVDILFLGGKLGVALGAGMPWHSTTP